MELSMWAGCRSGILELALGTLLVGTVFLANLAEGDVRFHHCLQEKHKCRKRSLS